MFPPETLEIIFLERGFWQIKPSSKNFFFNKNSIYPFSLKSQIFGNNFQKNNCSNKWLQAFGKMWKRSSSKFYNFLWDPLTSHKEYNAYKNDTKHNHGFSLRPLIKDETDPKWGMEWTAKIFCTVKSLLSNS